MKYVAFLRGINVGGKNTLPMKELKALCVDIGFLNVRTYINSGNVLFESDLSEKELRTKLEEALREKTGKEIPVVIRSIRELGLILSSNPFPKAEPSKVGVMLFTDPVGDFLTDRAVTRGSEEIVPLYREVYVYYPDGMGRSKLKFHGEEKQGTVRNINTIRKIVEMNSGGNVH